MGGIPSPVGVQQAHPGQLASPSTILRPRMAKSRRRLGETDAPRVRAGHHSLQLFGSSPTHTPAGRSCAHTTPFHKAMGHPRGCGRSRRQQELHRKNSLGTIIPPKSPPTPPTRGGHARYGHTNKRCSRDHPSSSHGPSTSSLGANNCSASGSAASTQDLWPSNPTFSQSAQRTTPLPGLVLDHAITPISKSTLASPPVGVDETKIFIFVSLSP
jgi:hypothetical protein